MLSFSRKRDYKTEPYWQTNNFWPEFLSRTDFDHHFLVDVFKCVVGEAKYRKIILEHQLGKNKYLFNDYDADDGEVEILKSIKHAWNKSKKYRKVSFITYFYPPMPDEHNELHSHYCILICNPKTKVVQSIDSRGLLYASTTHKAWEETLHKIKEVFSDCLWTDVIECDTQALTPNDHFCQTWSLIHAINLTSNSLRQKPSHASSSCVSLSNTSVNSNPSDKDHLSDSGSQHSSSSSIASYDGGATPILHDSTLHQKRLKSAHKPSPPLVIDLTVVSDDDDPPFCNRNSNNYISNQRNRSSSGCGTRGDVICIDISQNESCSIASSEVSKSSFLQNQNIGALSSSQLSSTSISSSSSGFTTIAIAGTGGFESIIAFWKAMLRIPAVREEVYYEVYRKTHTFYGVRHYDRYFSTLEQLVVVNDCSINNYSASEGSSSSGDSSSGGGRHSKKTKIDSNEVGQITTQQQQTQQYYSHGVAYFDTGYTFLEDFVFALSDSVLQKILQE